MKTKNASPACNVVLAALFLALAFVLPMVTGHLPQVGNMLCPMHFPILLCGFVLGGPWGLAVGFAAPLLRCSPSPFRWLLSWQLTAPCPAGSTAE